jgi:hypothetical protein
VSRQRRKTNGPLYWWMEIVLMLPMFLFWPSLVLYLMWRKGMPGGSPHLFDSLFHYRPWLAVLFALLCPAAAAALSVVHLKSKQALEKIGAFFDVMIILAGTLSASLILLQIFSR